MPSVYQSQYTANVYAYYGNAGLLSNKFIRGHELKVGSPYTSELKIFDITNSTPLVTEDLIKDNDDIAPYVGFIGKPRLIATDPFDAFICTLGFDIAIPRIFCYKNTCEYTTQSGTSPVCHACSTDIVFNVGNCQGSPNVRFFKYRIEKDPSSTDTELQYHGLMILENFDLLTTS
jgi:hypothetical protein